MTIGMLEGMLFARAPLISSQKLDTTLRTSSFLRDEDFIRAPPPEGGDIRKSMGDGGLAARYNIPTNLCVLGSIPHCLSRPG